MPTFLILKGSSVKETVRGANATALRTAILSAAADAAKGAPKASASFSGSGKTLGAAPTGGQATPSRAVSGDWLPNFGALFSSPAQFSQGRGMLQTAVRFVGLYFTTLFSLIPDEAGRDSPFAVRAPQGRVRRL